MRMNHELSSGGISTYYADLDAAAKRRYDEKLDMLPGLLDDSRHILTLFLCLARDTYGQKLNTRTYHSVQ